MKFTFLKYAFATLLITSIISCSKEESIPVNNRLEGIWQVNSFKLNSIETIGFVVDDMTIEFSAGDDGKGISKWMIDGDESVISYQLAENDTRLLYSDSDFMLIVNESTLSLDGMVDDDDVIIKATKK